MKTRKLKHNISKTLFLQVLNVYFVCSKIGIKCPIGTSGIECRIGIRAGWPLIAGHCIKNYYNFGFKINEKK